MHIGVCNIIVTLLKWHFHKELGNVYCGKRIGSELKYYKRLL